jgi:hypothetical protein
MSKSTETTNDRVPRVLVRFGKHPSSVWKHPSSVWKHIIERGETSIERGETSIERGETHIERGEAWGCAEALPKGGVGCGGVLGLFPFDSVKIKKYFFTFFFLKKVLKF